MNGMDRRQFVAGGSLSFVALAEPVSAARSAARPSGIVETADGRLKGVLTADGHVFRGVPYAADTGGRNRFMAPRPAVRWAGVRDATRFGHRAPQDARGAEPPARDGGDAPVYGEDCCVLNVYTPGLGGGRRPVMVFIHGGGFRSGSGDAPTLDGGRLARTGDVVVVTLNRRLNVLGFANLGSFGSDFTDSANVGQLDLVAALCWVRTNIASFGGDPDRVTLFGVSGGGSAIETLSIMPEARGLFHRTINMSGSSVFAMRTEEDMVPVAETFLASLGLTRATVRDLQTMPPDRLRAAYDAASRKFGMGDYRPVVDGRHIPHPPLSGGALAIGGPLPGIMSCTATEASVWLAGDRRNVEITEDALRRRVSEQFGFDATRAASVLAAYREQSSSRTPWDLLVTIASDALVRTPMRRASIVKADAGLSPVWCAEFDWRSPVDGGVWGAAHSIDVPFAFGTIDRSRLAAGGGDQARMVERAEMSAFAAFAHSGRPTSASLPRWDPFDSRTRETMVIAAPCRLVSDYRAADRRAADMIPSQDAFAIIAGPLFRAA